MMDHKPLRVLHCPVLALYQQRLLAEGLRSAGVCADSMIFDHGGDNWLSLGVDINLSLDGFNNLEKLRKILFFLIDAARHYDVFHFHSGRTLLPLWVDSRWSPLPESLKPKLPWLRNFDFSDLWFLKRLGKKLVFSFWGCDIRAPKVWTSHPDYICNYCLPSENQCRAPFRKHLHRALNKYADAVLLSGDLGASWPDSIWLPNAIDLEAWDPEKIKNSIPEKYKINKNGKLFVLHAFANGNKRGDHKGSHDIKIILDKLRQQGVPIKYIFLDNVTVMDVKYFQVQADIVIDQFRVGCYGSFAMESMALGRPVVGWVEKDLYRNQVEPPPIVNAHLANLEQVIMKLVNEPETRRQVGLASRQYAEKIHDHRIVGIQLKKIYESLYA